METRVVMETGVEMRVMGAAMEIRFVKIKVMEMRAMGHGDLGRRDEDHGDESHRDEGHRDKSHRGQDHGDGIARGLGDSVVEKESGKGMQWFTPRLSQEISCVEAGGLKRSDRRMEGCGGQGEWRSRQIGGREDIKQIMRRRL